LPWSDMDGHSSFSGSIASLDAAVEMQRWLIQIEPRPSSAESSLRQDRPWLGIARDVEDGEARDEISYLNISSNFAER
jgi:hypothetical protein